MEFKYTFPPFCIDKNYSTLRVLSFGYINPFYPLALLIITYICIELYDKNYRLFRAVWLPFRLCLSFIQKHLSVKFHINAKLNVLNVFATFIVLAYCKILYTNFAFLVLHSFMRAMDIRVEHNILFTMLQRCTLEKSINFTLSWPLLCSWSSISFQLLLYPTKLFQKLLNCFPPNALGLPSHIHGLLSRVLQKWN